MTLTKQRIARQLSEKQDITIDEAQRQVDAVLRLVKERLAVGGKVMITNFGTFEAVERATRRGVNPATGRPMVIPAHRAVAFHPAPRMQRQITDE